MANIVLIGMPGSGKSTVGVLLAKALGMEFIDTDVLLQAREGRLLQRMIDEDGIDAFLGYEEAAILSLSCENTVVATGGSVVYSDRAVAHLKALGTLVYLHLPAEPLVERLTNLATRGVALRPGQSIQSLFMERDPLYVRAADVTVDTLGLSAEETVAAIRRALEDERHAR